MAAGGMTKAKKTLGKINGENWLLIFTVIAVILGIIVGVSVKFSDGGKDLTPRQIGYIKFPGEIFLRMLKLIILPLITSSLINSLTSLDTHTAGRMGLWAAAYYFSTTFLAVVTGIILVVAIRPGSYGDKTDFGDLTHKGCRGTLPADTIMDLIRNMFPPNIIAAAFKSTSTCPKMYKRMDNASFAFIGDPGAISSDEYFKYVDKNITVIQNSFAAVPELQTKYGMNILGLVVFSLVFGGIINSMGVDGRPLAEFFRALEKAMMKMVTLVIWISPVGIFFLIVAAILGMDDLVRELARLALYMATVIGGLLIHGGITLPILLFVIGKRNPFKFVYGMLQALLTALGTASSSATMPLTLKCLEEKNGISKKVTRFMIPLGATINMDGTALYEAVAAIYIAQSIRVPMGIGKIILTSLTATLASIGAAGIPQAGLVTMVMVLTAADLPPQMVVYILPVDWFLDRIRTMINVHGDSLGTAIVQRIVRKNLDLDEDETNPSNNNGFGKGNGVTPITDRSPNGGKPFVSSLEARINGTEDYQKNSHYTESTNM